MNSFPPTPDTLCSFTRRVRCSPGGQGSMGSGSAVQPPLQGSRFGVEGVGCRVPGAECRVQSSGSRDQGARHLVEAALRRPGRRGPRHRARNRHSVRRNASAERRSCEQREGCPHEIPAQAHHPARLRCQTSMPRICERVERRLGDFRPCNSSCPTRSSDRTAPLGPKNKMTENCHQKMTRKLSSFYCCGKMRH